jgi:hypothetical protein
MHSDGKSDLQLALHPVVRELPLTRRHFIREPPPSEATWGHITEDARRQFVARAAVHARHLRLVEEHRDLDELISYLSDSLAPDDALLARLKKRKLSIKDEIARIETPS